MRVSVWKQDLPGKRWRRIGVVVLDMHRALPFRYGVRCGPVKLPQSWPRLYWMPMEVIQYRLGGVR